MTKHMKTKYIQGLLAGLMTLVFVAGCSTSGHKVTGTLRPPVAPEAVKFYNTMPPHAEIIGAISAVSFRGVTLEQADQDALNKLKIEAGKLGANGILLGASNDRPMDGAKVQAKAIYVSP